MANWSLPTTASTYVNYTTELDGRLKDLAYGLDPAVTSVTNQPTNTIRWNSATARWEKYNGTSWAGLATTYAINAATASKLAAAVTINGVSFDGSANITLPAQTFNALTFSSSGNGAASGTTFDASVARIISYNSVGAPSVTGANATGSNWAISITGSSASCSGNAATVTNGVYTTGAQTIAGDKTFTGLTTVSSGSAGGIAFPANPGGGTGDSAWIRYYAETGENTVLEIGANNDTDDNIWLNASGGTLCQNNFSATGNISSTSDERLKTNWVPVSATFLEELAKVKHGVYTRIDSGDVQIGVSAQSLREVMPQAVGEDKNGHLAVAYGNAALTACVVLAAEVVELRKELKAIKESK